MIIQGQVSYFVADGLAADLDTQVWFSFDDDAAPLYTLAPGLSYYFYQLGALVPYVGTFYQHIFTTVALSHRDFIGGRGGIILRQDWGLIGAGVRLNYALSCDQECAQFAPEFTARFSF